ncbi:hypothetical protein LVD15_24800 [Fulvivirga maritima]|uniref:hypothetical protein n=1 Tax=Fulvivirga maritima TaxID=2904247 RepID=UPI001F399F1B|nr:hypothetical protein [Fulvivirga maritima]UII26477.1 hypothetical protein LVD15_24800 [Fulvivirga maritima]
MLNLKQLSLERIFTLCLFAFFIVVSSVCWGKILRGETTDWANKTAEIKIPEAEKQQITDNLVIFNNALVLFVKHLPNK